ncbi:unnamed protein product [Schistosoma margrebowiei]|uniref:Uncharacterized protein n=1 Tax=Schistosoma margrebowiei TaxID=48269 RepID=A0A183N397_9TREM|nr:unnamed protein product [Schistosoma margrebowiei]
MKNNWKGIKKSQTTYRKNLGNRHHRHKEWIFIETLGRIQQTKNKKKGINNSQLRAEKARAHSEYTEVNKRAERSIRYDRKKYTKDLAIGAGRAPREGNLRQLRDTIRRLAGKCSKLERQVKNEEGKTITGIQEQ